MADKINPRLVSISCVGGIFTIKYNMYSSTKSIKLSPQILSHNARLFFHLTLRNMTICYIQCILTGTNIL